MRRCVVEVKPLDSLGIGYQVSVNSVPETRNLKPVPDPVGSEAEAENTDLVAVDGQHWVILI